MYGIDQRGSSNIKQQQNNLQKSSKGVAQNERGEFVTIGEIEELPPTGNFKGSMSQFSKGVDGGNDYSNYNMAEQIRAEEERSKDFQN